MKYTNEDKAKHIREALRNGDSINQVCHDYDLTFPELVQRMSSYGSGIKHSMKYTGERYIMKHHGNYVIRKKNKYFGTYKSLGDAITVRDWFICHRWDKRWIDRACRECNIQRCTKSKKRFTLIDMNNIEKELLSPIKDNGSDCLTWFEVVECLNALHEENVKLQARNKYLATKIQRERNSYQKQHEKWEKEIQKENDELKQRIKELEQEVEKLDTFKKILEYAGNDSDRVDWQSYCEKEFGGL